MSCILLVVPEAVGEMPAAAGTSQLSSEAQAASSSNLAAFTGHTSEPLQDEDNLFSCSGGNEVFYFYFFFFYFIILFLK
jgi:hypothetical protein